MRRALLIFFVLALYPVSSDAVVKVKSIRHRSFSSRTRVVVDLSEDAEFEKLLIPNPERLLIDIRGIVQDSIDGSIEIGDGVLKGVRAAQFSPETVRVVLDLDRFDNFRVFALRGPPRLVIDVYAAGKSYRLPDASREAIKRVVIDAGHGGNDPGALGPGRLREKDVVLDIAVKLKALLEKEGYEAFLTRNRDRALNLEERTIFANRKKADLFISIHANANHKRKVRGIETYLLNWTDNEEAMKVAARENFITTRRMKERRSELDIILAALELQNKRDESLRLAHYVHRSMISELEENYSGISDLGIKQAFFYVLVGANMPSVLVEVSHVTNPQEARRLLSRSYRRNIAEGIASGIKAYFNKALQTKNKRMMKPASARAFEGEAGPGRHL